NGDQDPDNGDQDPQPPAGEQRGSAGTYDIASSGQDAGEVGPGATVFQGEEDITFVDSGGTTIAPTEFERTAGANEGETLSMPIPTDQPTGSYEATGSGFSDTSITVSTPRIQNLEITNRNDDDVAGGAVNIEDSTELTLDVQYNFQQAEPLDVTIEDANGLEVTDSVLQQSGPFMPDDGTLSLDFLEDELDNEEYTITVEGDEDLDFGEASQSTTLDVTSGDEVAIDVQEDQVTRGEDVTFEIDQSGEGNTHLVTVESDDIEGDAADVFRNVGDTIATASDNAGAYALVEIDDGVGVGSIDTSPLDETDVTVDVYDADTVDSNNDGEGVTASDLTAVDPGTNSADDDDFEVTEGSVTLDNPMGTYVVGSETTVNGTTSSGVDDVALYARSEGDYEFLTTIDVDGDDTFEEEDIVLSDTDDVGSDILSLPGTYRLAVVDATDEALGPDADDNNPFNLDQTQNTSAISQAVGEQYSLRVTETSLTVDYVSIINGQVAEDDTLSINGTAPGKNEVSVSFYGPRGTYDSQSVSVDTDGTFDEDNIDVGGNLGALASGVSTEISQGNVVMTVLSNGRDDTTGDGDFGNFQTYDPSYDDSTNWALDLNERSLTQQQLINVVSSETVDDTGSDDISEVFQFRYTDGTVSVDSVTSPGADEPFLVSSNSTMTVSGTTNKQPDDNSITVEIIDGPSSSDLSIESTDMWGTDGQWSVEVDTAGAEPGNYTVEASVDGNTDVRSFQVTDEQFEEPTEPEPTDTATEPEPEPEPEPTTEEPTDTTEEPVETTAAGTDEPAEETTTATGPGFTAVLALVALVAAALLAVRRRD
ncbi:major cell surface glycoprotein, partial [Halorientalis persicus]